MKSETWKRYRFKASTWTLELSSNQQQQKRVEIWTPYDSLFSPYTPIQAVFIEPILVSMVFFFSPLSVDVIVCWKLVNRVMCWKLERMICRNVYLLTQSEVSHIYCDVGAQQTAGFLRASRFCKPRSERIIFFSGSQQRLLASILFIHLCSAIYHCHHTSTVATTIHSPLAQIICRWLCKHLAAERLVHELPMKLAFSRHRMFASVAWRWMTAKKIS